MQACTATAKTTGEPCKGKAIRGTHLCRMHGVNGALRAKAKRVVAEQTALQSVTAELAHLGLPDRDPLEHMEAVLAADAYDAAFWSLAVQGRVDAGEPLTTTNKHGEELLHPFVAAKNQAAQRWSATSKRALDAGVAQRRVAILEEQASLVLRAARAAVAHLEGQEQERVLTNIGRELRQLGPGL